MAKIEQTIVLNFQTQLQQAKSDILELAKLSQQAKIAPGQTGALSSPERFGVEQAISEQAMQSGVSPDEMKAVLEDINKILEQEASIKARADELSVKRLENETKIKTQEQEKNALITEGAQLLGLRADASLQEVTAAKRKLDTEIASGNATKEQLELHKKVSTVFDSLSTKNRSIGQLIRNNGTITEDITNSIKEQDNAFNTLRVTLDKLTLTSEQRENIEAKLTPIILQQTQQVRQLEQAQKKSAEAAKENAKAQDAINSSLRSTPKTFAEKATGAFLYFQAVQAIRRVARAAVTTLVELDRALTDIAIVTTMTRQETQGLIGTYQKMAKEVGLTTTEVVKLSTAFFRQGREAEDALRLTQTAAVFARIAAINVNDAANFLTAAINGFNLAASESTRIIDRFAALGANAAASAQEIAIALSKVAPAAASAGVGIDNLMAFVTKAIETTREAPENIGTAFKTIFARMRQLTDIGKVDEDGTDVNNVEKALRNIGVELRDAQGEFRDLDKVLIDVGKRWPDITRSQQAYVATTLAGTRQQTRLIALFENFDRTLELITVSQNSAGAAAIQHAKFMEGLEAATTNLKTSFQEFITSIANSDQMLFIIDGLRVGIDLLNTVFGKLILTGAVYKLGVMAMANQNGRFFKAITGAKNGLLSMLQPFGFVTKAKSALIVKTKALNNLLSQNVALGLKMPGPLDAVMKKESILTKVRAKGLFALTSQTRAGIQGTANLNGMSLAQAKAIFILKKYTRVLDGSTFAGIKKIAVDKNVSVTQVLVGMTAKAAGNAVAKASLKMMKAMAKLLLSPMALVIALGSIVLALKKMADATDTTNPMVAEFQIRIKKAADALKNIVKRVKDFFGNLINGSGLAAKMFQGLLKYIQFVFKIYSKIPIIGKMFQAFTEDLTATEKAAAGIVVLTNKIKDLNQEIRKTESENQKLVSSLDKFNRLSRQRFRTAEETSQLEELQGDLQGRLGTTAVGFELSLLARETIANNNDKIERITSDIRDLIKVEFERNPMISFSDLLNSDMLTEEMKANLPLLLQTFGETVIEGFDKMAPEVQAALSRLFTLEPDFVKDLTAEFSGATEAFAVKLPAQFTRTVHGMGANTRVVTEEVEMKFAKGIGFDEAFRQALDQGYQGTIDEFASATDGRFATVAPINIDNSALGKAVADTAAFLATANDITSADEFNAFLIQLKANLEGVETLGLSAEDLILFQQALSADGLQDFSSLIALSEEARENLFNQGGTAYVRSFTAGVGEAISRLDFEDVIGLVPIIEDGLFKGVENRVIESAEQVGANFTSRLIAHIQSQDKPMSEVVADLVRDGFEGVDLSGIDLAGSLLNTVDINSVRTLADELIADTNRVIELAAKSPAELTAADIEFLRKEENQTAFLQMGAGTFDPNAFRAERQAEGMEMLNETAAASEEMYLAEKFRMADLLGISRETSDEEIAAAVVLAEQEGRITEVQKNRFEFSLREHQLNLQDLDLAKQRLAQNKAMTDEIKARYKVQIDLLKSQMDSIKDAEKIRNLQEQSADVARRSMEATRIGAVGSMEAKFNQQQINQEVAKMNRALQDQMQTAQLEAQQKILEDSQQKAIEAATNKLTIATVELTEEMRESNDLNRESREAETLDRNTPPPPPTFTPTPFNPPPTADRYVLEIPGYGPYSRS